MQSPRRFLTIHSLNTVLLVAILSINAYIISAPLAPRLLFQWQKAHAESWKQTHIISSRPNPGAETGASLQLKKPNSLIISGMLFDQTILEAPVSQSSAVLKQGVWRWSKSSTPDRGGNTVLIAHRFTYSNPRGAFYLLDTVRVGDEINIIWQNKSFTYQVVSSRTVAPTDTSIEDATSDSRLTLFTCTPLWHPVNRLVVVAELVSPV